MRKNILILSMSAILGCGSALAADDSAVTDGTLTITGEVVAPACTIATDSRSSSVAMDKVSATKLQTLGQESGVKKDIPINLTDCDTTATSNAAFTFTAEADPAVATAFKNQNTGGGAATNVAVQMYMPDGTTKIIPNTETAQDGITLAGTADQTITFKVDYVATGRATAGTVQVMTTFHINYY
ncbi:fimbrial protein [Pseudocitrobacter faecalis]|uniref:fimbrial protein n=1 Tax=Pseudocitrobacter faecalis TaxID=1398493 RepID=UPI0039EE2B2A